MMAAAEATSRGAAVNEVVSEWLAEEAPRLRGQPVLFTHALSVPAHEPEFAPSLFLRYIGDRRRLFLVRDPRDTVVSHYFQIAKRARRHADYDPGAIGDFVRDPLRGIDRILALLRACSVSLEEDPGPALLLSYEELHRDGTRALGSALAFFGASAGDDELGAAVEYGHFANMQRLEREGALAGANRRLVARDPTDPESFKTRRGEVGSYREYLSEEDASYVQERIAALLPERLGYRQPGMPPDAPGSA
jgi:hypothetical protein